ncbi:MAG: metalloregulator ArsR/SmtB family transcription factor [Candidatus Omnitrophica bacterium]|nr:metalloregulator ArsR/SmtB family transcription factor [Candidatus Omnitrophota bacterium]
METLAKEVRFFSALANETRLRILILLSQKELCGCHLEWALGLTQAKVSRHLKVLKDAGLVKERREGLWVFYSLSEPQTELEKDFYKYLNKYFVDKYNVIKQDLLNLEKVICKPLEQIPTIRNINELTTKGGGVK